MSIETACTAAPRAAGAEASPSRATRPRAAVSESPRPLSGKRALLHARRLRIGQERVGAAANAEGSGASLLRAEDGAVMFILRSCAAGLLIERTQRRPLGACLVQTLLFSDHDGFKRWCEADAIRFDEPVLYDRLRREGHARLGGER